MSKSEMIYPDEYVASDCEAANICVDCAHRYSTIEWDDGYTVRCTLWRHNVTGEYIFASVARRTASMCSDGEKWKMPPEKQKTIYEACLSAAYKLGDEIKGLSWFGKNRK